MAFVIQTPEPKSLGELLGTGISKGIEARLGEKAKLRQTLALQQQQGLTPFQQISTAQREKERKRKTENAVISALSTLSDIKRGVLLPQDVPSVASNVTDLIEQGVNATQALDQVVEDYRNQRLSLSEIDIPNFKAKNAENLRKDILDKLKENNIKNPSIIGRALKKKKWPSKEIQNITRTARKGEIIPERAEKKEAAIQEKMPPASQHVGRVIREKRTGRKFRSDGRKWTEIK